MRLTQVIDWGEISEKVLKKPQNFSKGFKKPQNFSKGLNNPSPTNNTVSY